MYKASLFPLFQKGKWAKIRELHVYGFISGTKSKTSFQHRGVGKNLMRLAETIAWWEGCKGCSVISGVGVRGYYKRLGYSLDTSLGEFMTKTVDLRDPWLIPFLWFIRKEWWLTKKYDYARGKLLILPSFTGVFLDLARLVWVVFLFGYLIFLFF